MHHLVDIRVVFPTIHWKLPSNRYQIARTWAVLKSFHFLVMVSSFYAPESMSVHIRTPLHLGYDSVIFDSWKNFRTPKDYAGSSCDPPLVISLMSRG